jgi:hypothetical protein
MLSGHQTQPGGELPSIPNGVTITNGGHNRRGRHRPDAFHSGDALAFRVLPEGPLDPLIGRSDFHFQFHQLFVERMEQVPGRNSQLARSRRLPARQGAGWRRSSATCCGRTIPYSASSPRIWLTNCVPPHRSAESTGVGIADPAVQSSWWNKTHARSARSFAGRLSIVDVILLRITVENAAAAKNGGAARA